MLAGGLTVELEGVRHVMSAGDSIHFASTRVHATWNHTTGITTLLHTGKLDVFGDAVPGPGAAGLYVTT